MEQRLIVGIGNPEEKYRGTRHNIGFDIVDCLAEKLGKAKWKKDADALVAEASDGTMLMKSALFVNNTGGSVERFAGKKGLKAEDVLVVCDDVNLDFGKFRLRDSGSAGGHHGLESVIEKIGEGFPRLRFGVRRADMPQDLTDFVLGPFDKEERAALHELIDQSAQIAYKWATEGYAQAGGLLSRFHSKRTVKETE